MLEPTIGIEIHVLLKSQSKVFTNSLNSFNEIPNENIALGDLAYPGTLPTLNKEVVNMALKAALAFNCKINKKMHFDRKNYFYPDLSKGYQITQDMTPIGYDGYVEIEVDGNFKKIAIERIHIEEDTCKSIHSEKGTLLDFNRAGVPLIEIVTKPVITSDIEAVKYVDTIRETLLYLGVSDVKIEEGSMRCDVNISLKEKESDQLGTKVEIKNIGSVSNVGTSILYEINRQKEILGSGKKVIAETRRFDDSTNKTLLMRVKDENTDYRYHPEPNLPYIYLTDDIIKEVQRSIQNMPKDLRKKYSDLGINQNNINTIVGNYDMCMFLEKIINNINPVIGANILTGEISSYLNKNKLEFNNIKLTVDNFQDLVNRYEKNEISSKQLKTIIPLLLETGENIQNIIDKLGLKQINNEEEILKIINNVINNNSKSVDDYKSGQDRALKYLMGQIMKESKGQVNPELANKLLVETLNR